MIYFNAKLPIRTAMATNFLGVLLICKVYIWTWTHQQHGNGVTGGFQPQLPCTAAEMSYLKSEMDLPCAAALWTCDGLSIFPHNLLYYHYSSSSKKRCVLRTPHTTEGIVKCLGFAEELLKTAGWSENQRWCASRRISWAAPGDLHKLLAQISIERKKFSNNYV